jgi:replicative DNA helicase
MNHQAFISNEKSLLMHALQGQFETGLDLGLCQAHFSKPEYVEIFLAAYDCYLAGNPIEITTVTMRLKNNDTMPIAIDLFDPINDSSLNIEHFIAVANDINWIKKTQSQLATAINAVTAWNPGQPLDPIVEHIRGIEEPAIVRAVEKMRLDEGALDEFSENLESILENPEKHVAMPTGINEIDTILNGGVLPGRMITIAARPGCGKTALATNMVNNIAKHGHRCLYFSIEMPRNEMISRFVCIESGIKVSSFSRNQFTGTELDAYMELMRSDFRRRPITVNCKTNGSWAAVEAHIRKEHRQKGLKLAVIDYIQQFKVKSADKKFVSKREEIEHMTGAAKLLALELGIGIIIVAQLNRDIEKRQTAPVMSDLKESGSIEQDSDVVMILWSPNEVQIGNTIKKSIEVRVVKNRSGPMYHRPLNADLSVNKFFSEPTWQGP